MRRAEKHMRMYAAAYKLCLIFVKHCINSNQTLSVKLFSKTLFSLHALAILKITPKSKKKAMTKNGINTIGYVILPEKTSTKPSTRYA